MKANELRIGNYIVWESTGEVEIVKDIVTHGRKYHTINNINIKDAKPIPLTEEWLVRFGFDHGILQANHNEINYTDHAIVRGMSGAIHFDKCKYVHQLQNLYFALTGEELNFY